ncbi:unnamed protein product, partial [Musa hybrid cultivar]
KIPATWSQPYTVVDSSGRTPGGSISRIGEREKESIRLLADVACLEVESGQKVVPLGALIVRGAVSTGLGGRIKRERIDRGC